jgi:two-component system, OmpR family, alkaline phosphatase synthesis response regulator PhoP
MGPKDAARPRILLVEDDEAIAAGLRLNLKHEGFVVQVERDGEEGLAAALKDPPELVLLDVMLPTMNGYEILRELRRRGSTAGVIMLTAKGLEEDKVMGLDLGADDYVQKPFSLVELIARVNAVLRRRAAQQPTLSLFGDVEVDRRARTVRRAGEPLALSPREMGLLLFFLEHPGRAHTRDGLLEGAWGLDYEGTERTVDNFVVSLRKKLEQDAESPRHFLTVRGVGYRFDPIGVDPPA